MGMVGILEMARLLGLLGMRPTMLPAGKLCLRNKAKQGPCTQFGSSTYVRS